MSWIDLIADEASHHWSRGKPLFLAQIPPLLRLKGVDLHAILAGRTLREAIGIDGVEKIALVRDPQHELSWGVVPKSVLPNINLDVLFARSPKNADTCSRNRENQVSAVLWAAFIKEIAPSTKRWITRERFFDLPEGERPPENSNCVERTDLVHVQGEVATPSENDAIHASIQKWAARNSIDLSAFRVAQPNEIEKPIQRRDKMMAFENLNEEDQRRILIPLDIVLKLLQA